MTFNYTTLGNQSLQNMLPIFASCGGGIATNSGTIPNHHPNFMNQIAAAINNTSSLIGNNLNANTTPAKSAVTTPVATSTVLTKCEHHNRPETSKASKLNSSYIITPKMNPNQGAVPMDLENEYEHCMPDTNIAISTSQNNQHQHQQQQHQHHHHHHHHNNNNNNNNNNVSSTTTLTPNSKTPTNLHDPNLYLSGLMSAAGMNAAAAAANYMFFPAASATQTQVTTTTNSTPTAATMLMDPNAMMAAAMQQIQQGYAGYGLTENPVDTSAQTVGNAETYGATTTTTATTGATTKEVINTKNCILFPPNPNAPPPTIRERPLGCRTVFVGGLPENISEEIIREIFESCGEITTLRMSKKNFCHIRYRHETSIDRAIYLSGYRVRISNINDPGNYGRLHVDYAQARDDQYDYECKQRQLQREQRHRERMSLDRLRSQSPPPIPHYSEHEASVVAENLRNNETFIKAIQTISIWLERGDCTKRNANMFYSMIQSTHAHVRRLHSDKQQLEEDLRKARESYRKQMQTMSTQFTQIEKVFSAASHKKCWDHFTKAQRKNIDQWKKLASELRTVRIEDDEMEMSDDERDNQNNSSSSSSQPKRQRLDSDNLKEENDSLRCQLEAIRHEMSLERSDIKYDSDFREKQIKVLQETIRNMQTQLLQTKVREQKDTMNIEQLERKLKEAGVRQLLLKTKIKEYTQRLLKDKETASSLNSEASETLYDEQQEEEGEDADSGGGGGGGEFLNDVVENMSNEANDNSNNNKKSNEFIQQQQQQQQQKEEEKSATEMKQQQQQQQMQMQMHNDLSVVLLAKSDDDDDDDDVKIIEDQDDVVIIQEIEDDDDSDDRNAERNERQVTKIDVNHKEATTTKITTKESQNLQNKNKTKTENETETKVEIETKTETENAFKCIKPIAEAEETHVKTDAKYALKFAALASQEAKVIALTTAFLIVQPLGVTTNKILNYLNDLMPEVEFSTNFLENILRKYKNLFEIQNSLEEIDKKTNLQWKFCGFLTETTMTT